MIEVARVLVGLMILCQMPSGFAASVRSMPFRADTPDEAVRWQHATRDKLFELLMGGSEPERVPLKPEVLRRIDVPAGGYVLEELTLQTLPDRRAHVWMAVPKQPRARVGAVLALHGHGGSGEEVARGLSLYWYGRALAEMGYVVIAPDVGQHELQHENWTLMGERVWDALRCLDYLQTRPEVDSQRLAVAGLSLGGETAMYVAALDERVKAACSSGWLTTAANMKNGHCPCFDFPGLEENFDFSDIFACVAPRPLALELGERERAPGGFPVSIGRGAFEEIRRAYRVLGAEESVQLAVHPGGHVFIGRDLWEPLRQALGTPYPWFHGNRSDEAPGSAAPPSTDEMLPSLPPGQRWQLVWNDEFDGHALNPKKWDVMGDWKRRDGFWIKDDAYLDGRGHLLLRTKKEGDRYTSGAIRTLGRFEHAFGYWVARCKLPEQPGHWPAFWLMSSGVNKIGDEGRDGTEIDIMEAPWRTGQITMNLHWDGYGSDHKSKGTNFVRPDLMQGFHTFGLWWATNEYVFYADGQETWRASAGGVSQVPQYIKLTEEIGKWAGAIQEAKFPDYFEVDYVRVYDAVPDDGKGESAAGGNGENDDIQTENVKGLFTSDATEELLRRGEIARRCFTRALGVLDSWWATRDPATGLYPRRLDQSVWAPADNAADMFPFLSITAHLLAPERLAEVLQIIPKERALTTRHAGLPDWFSITNRAFAYAGTNLNRLIFGGAEYCKDGLIPMTEVMGRGPWTERMIELMDAVFAVAPVQSDFGPLPADDTEVNGDLLQVLARLHAMSGESKYLQWAERIGDAYCLEVLPSNGGLPPHRWDFSNHAPVKDTLNLNDHGNELIGGLAELFVATKHFHPEKAAQYEKPLRQMFHRLLEKARNKDGLWYNLVKASTGEVLNSATPDTWGYALAATHTFGTATGDLALLNTVRGALQKIDQPRYLHWNDADAYADAIEGSLLLLNRVPEPAGFAWLEKMLPLFLGKQRDNGIVEGWYGDGNYARTALMAAFYFTQGATCHPWRADLRFGAVREGDALHLVIVAEEDWEGTLRFDTSRHREHLRLPVNYARLNEFPEWFTIESTASYQLRVGDDQARRLTGAELAGELPLRLRAREALAVRMDPPK